ncbi:Anaerobic glycerol-3-phosphate dehydrogenase subunit C [Roseimaritima multifibrata]|uniref:Anaerobic glycerol-3-phosphate dehydrogenase subunit C n=1 Tax=Roseimaritima multifibrata TaxID=1930274 RepID=A0A517M925_9BACT|nr:FAD-binding and (Fe-S)-binding domain-containing protein [Roseimaritima multifibrata]QDS91386.1 Anaerobic glycerol-3-phosphate dehydrogenase subunit C [Roseimaritima multifibrata]
MINASEDPATNDTIDSSELQRLLKQGIRGEVYVDDVSRGVYATDASLFQMFPRCVVVPRDQADLCHAMKIAAAHKISVTPRGGATSLSGQTYGPGIILDVSKYMNQVLAVDVQAQTARVQPGVVRDQLNAAVAADQLHFAPDPATGSRATIGGMIGNNTCGTRSVVYGKTIDHVLACRVLLADGTVAEFEQVEPAVWQARAAGENVSEREAELYRGVTEIISEHHDQILQRYPKVLRRVSGYNLDEFVDGAGYTGTIGPRAEQNQGKRPWNLSNLIVGSEGTLGVVLEATVRLTPLPQASAVCVVHFSELLDSLKYVDAMLQHEPSTVELLDETVMREAKVNSATQHMSHFIEGDPAAVQIVEFFGQDLPEAQRRCEQFATAMKEAGIGYSWPVLSKPSDVHDVWETRKLGLGLISNVRGANKGRDFIEDACVPTAHLAEYISKIQQLCTAQGITRLSLYAHASVGVVHVVPALDLHQHAEAEKMQAIADQAFQWVMEYGGSWSGEHGDGQLRGQYLPAMFGDDLYEAFRQVKRLFDPNNLMNPGKVIDSQTLLDNLRYQPPGYAEAAEKSEQAALYKYADQGGLQLAVEQCNGVGACRKIGSGTMCPSYMATRDEQHSTRGRANALRLAMSGQLEADPLEGLASDGLHDVLSLCLACKACKSECPNAVDMAKLKSEALQIRHDRKGISLGAKVLGRMPDAAKRFAGWTGNIANLTNWIPGGRALLQRMVGIDRRRPLPTFATTTLAQSLQRDPVPTGRRDRGRVVLFDDTYANYFEPNLGRAAIGLLEDAGYEVILAKAGCCQRTRLSKGLVREAKKYGVEVFRRLDVFAQQGLPILCLEPSCASALVDDLPDLLDDRELAQRVAGQIQMLDGFLDREGIEVECTEESILLHGHCHQKATFGTSAIHALLGGPESGCCEEVDSGCCGMAGSFGYEHYDLSQQVGEDRLFPAVRQAVAEGRAVVACGISCRHQLKDCLGVDAKHFVEVLRIR